MIELLATRSLGRTPTHIDDDLLGLIQGAGTERTAAALSTTLLEETRNRIRKVMKLHQVQKTSSGATDDETARFSKAVKLLQARTTSSDVLDDERARLAAIVTALTAMASSYDGCTKEDNSACNTYSTHRAEIDEAANAAVLDANAIAPEQNTQFSAMKESFIQSLAGLDDMHQNCTADIAVCATTSAFETAVQHIVGAYEAELEQLQPETIPTTELLQRQLAGGGKPPVLLQSTVQGKCGTTFHFPPFSSCPAAAVSQLAECCEDHCAGEFQQALLQSNESKSTEGSASTELELLSVSGAAGVQEKAKVGWDCS